MQGAGLRLPSCRAQGFRGSGFRVQDQCRDQGSRASELRVEGSRAQVCRVQDTGLKGF